MHRAQEWPMTKWWVSMPGQTMGHIVIIVFILFGNIVYFVNRSRNCSTTLRWC